MADSGFPRAQALASDQCRDKALARRLCHPAGCALLLACWTMLAGFAVLDVRGAEPPRRVREIFVPFDALDVLLEGQPQRVLLSREEYEQLWLKARKRPDTPAPLPALVASAEYVVAVADGRALMTGTLAVDVLVDGLHALALELSGVGLRRAALDGKGAAVGRGPDGRLALFVQGKGRHQLALEMIAPVETTAAQQVLSFRLPRPAAARLRLTVPGDVELKSGADVASRLVDEDAGLTRFELLPRQGDTTLLMTLNSRLQRQQRAVVARSVLLDEVTEAYERLHAAVSFGILHRAVDEFRLVVPGGFEVTEVSSPLLARWAVRPDGQRRILEVRLREQTVETVVLHLSAVKTSPRADPWTMPKLEPLDVVGQVAVVGLLVDERLKAESIAAEGLISIDTAVLRQALPATVFRAEPGAPPIRPVVAFYAPQAAFGLSARLVKPPAEFDVTTHVHLVVQDQGPHAQGAFRLTPRVEKLFGFEVSVPAGWRITALRTADEKPLAFERYGPADKTSRVRVRLAQGVAPGQECRVLFEAEGASGAWLAGGEPWAMTFPVFAVAGAARDVGAFAVETRDDLVVRPQNPRLLTPLEEGEKAEFGLSGAPSGLAYRYEGQGYGLDLAIERTRPRVTAQTFSFLRVEPESLAAHHEILYRIDEARARHLAFSFPANTPGVADIRGLDGVGLKELGSALSEGRRRWNVLLAEPSRGRIRLAIDFRQPLPPQEVQAKGLALPVVRAEDVLYQSGFVAAEGSAELDVQVSTPARRLDVGELVDAEYQPGARLLGAFGFTGEPAEVIASIARHPGYPIAPAIVEKAELTTHLSADGVSQTAASFRLRAKALFLQVQLPERSALWSAEIDGHSIKPQRAGERLLVNLPAAASGGVCTLRVVYETGVRPVGLAGAVELAAPKLLLHASPGTEPSPVETADLAWDLYGPPGYEMVRSRGTVVAQLPAPQPAALTLAKGLAGAVLFSPGPIFTWGGCGCAAPRARMAAPKSAAAGRALPTAVPERDEAVLMLTERAAKEVKDEVPVGSLRDREIAKTAAPDKPREKGPPAGERKLEEHKAKADRRVKEGAHEADGTDRFRVPKAEPASEPAPAEQPAPATPPPPKPKKPPPPSRYVAGFKSLKIDLEQTAESGERVTFQSLGVDPRLVVTLAHGPRFETLGWALALAVLLAGVAKTNRPVAAKTRLIVGVVLLGTLIPMVPGLGELAGPCNLAVYAAALLVPYYLLARLARWLVRLGESAACIWRRNRAAATGAMVAMVLAAGTAQAGESPPAKDLKDGRFVIQVVEPPEPVRVPDDAVILPYDPDHPRGIHEAGKMLVPYAKYVELWNRAYPDKKLEAKPPPADFALAGASYTTTLEGEESLVVQGELEIDVYTEGFVSVPLGLGGGVLTQAELDGRPARLDVARPDPPPPPADGQQQAAPQSGRSETGAAAARSLLLLHVAGKGRHRLQLAVRLRLERRGGWRVAEGVLPSAPASALAISVPEPKTEVRLGRISDRPAHETDQPNQKIETALGPDGALSLQWRPQVAEAEVDRTLAARSAAVLDVQEDGLRLVWNIHLDFPRSQRETLRVRVPKEYVVEKVEGGNVRGWEVRRDQSGQSVDVSLLKAAKDREHLAIRLWRGGATGRDDLAQFDAPVLAVPDASLHSGDVTIRRSPLLELRTVSLSGVTRTDLAGPGDTPRAGPGPATEDSPLGIRPYQAYHFVTTPFGIRLAAAPLPERIGAKLETLLKISEYERSLETRVRLDVQNRPIHRIEILLPPELRLDDVAAPGEFHWAVTSANDRPVLTVYLTAGRQGEVSVVLRGRLGRRGLVERIALPVIEVRHVARQEGQIAVQLDPVFSVQAKDLVHCEPVLLERLYGWLQPEQRRIARLALHCPRPDYQGTLELSLRQPLVACTTFSNVKVTDRAFEETILLSFTVQQAGIRELAFLLPARMKDSRVSAPMLRQKTATTVGAGPDAALRVHLELQDEVMGELRVLVENDRLLGTAAEIVPIPTVETGRVERQFVALESAGRDEVVIESLHEVQAIGREHKDWQVLAGLLHAKLTQAYLVTPGAKSPRLGFRIQARALAETAMARIRFAQTRLVLDAHGAYRAEQLYKVDNKTEQFLLIELPEGARLWTAWVAREPVKPAQAPNAPSPRVVRVPLVKTARGDLDYDVVLQYGGALPALGTLASVNFPLIHTLNIPAELSQVRLYLPESHRWFDFGGTMRRAESEEELRGGLARYQAKQMQDLVETARQGSFGGVRALNNLKLLLESPPWGYGGSGVQALESSREGAALLQQAQQEISQRERPPAQPAEFDNRARFNEWFEGQKNARARNVTKEVGANWDMAQPQPEAANPTPFNTLWLDKNKIANPLPEQEGDKKLQRLLPDSSGGTGLPRSGGKGRSSDALPQGQPGPGMPVMPPMMPGHAVAVEGRPTTQQPAPADQPHRAGRSAEAKEDVLQRYQEKHRQMQQKDMPQSSTEELRRFPAEVAELSKKPGGAEQSAQQPAQAALGAPAFSADAARPVAGQADGAVAVWPVPTGLASLAVDLPLRGDVYLFTTPQGDVEITARAADWRMLLKCGQVAAVAVALLLVFLLVRIAQGGRLEWMTGRGGSTALICFGLLAVVFGVVVLPGVAALAAGLTLKVRRAIARLKAR